MDIIYEESAASKNQKKGQKLYIIVNVIYKIALVVAIIFLLMTIMNIPAGVNSEGDAMAASLAVFFGFITVFFTSIAVSTYLIRRRINISYDYIFVSGELRIAKVFNVNKRKLVARIEPEDFIQIGDIDNSSYARFKADPTVKEVIVTPNVEAAEGKFFMYALVTTPTGKKMYLLECREDLLINIMKFVKRGTLESDYVMQEKKNK